MLVLRVTGPDSDGDLWAEPAEWDGGGPAAHPGARPPRRPGARRRRPPARPDDRARRPGRPARRPRDPPHRHGAEAGDRHLPPGRIRRPDRRHRQARRPRLAGRRPATAPAPARANWSRPTQIGEARGYGLPRARIVTRLGDPSAPKSVSLIAIHEHGIPDDFPDAVLAEAEAAGPSRSATARICAPCRWSPSTRRTPATTTTPSAPIPTTTRRTPAATSSGSRSPTSRPTSAPDSALDREARRRGNSTYFPDRVVPMLPERLSGDLCSLIDGADRPCIAVRIVLDADGAQARPPLHPRPDALGRHAHLQPGAGRRRRPPGRRDRAACWTPSSARSGPPGPPPHRARDQRQPLNLDLPERRIVLDDEGKVLSVAFRERLDAHRADRGLHDPRQRRRRRDAGGKAPAPALPRPRGAQPRKARRPARGRGIRRPDPRQGPGAEDRPPQPPARRRRRHRARRDDQHVACCAP